MSCCNLSMVEATLPPGFRFHPRDEELICSYLLKKVSRCDHLQSPLLIEVDLNKCEPWQLPEMACVGGKEWYFYSQRDRKYATGLRTNRATVSGYWKATGKDRAVLRKRTLVGMRKTLVFYQGRAPKGKKTDWVMHEFRLEGPLSPPKPPPSSKEDWVLCRVFCKNREIYGAKQGSNNNNNFVGSSSCGYEDTISSSSLPPLMDPYGYSTLTFDQSQPTANNDEDQYEQVPCFSIFNSQNANLPHMINNMSSNPHHADCINIPNLLSSSICTEVGGTTSGGAKISGGEVAVGGTYNNNNDQLMTNLPSSSSSYSCEKKDVIKAVLSHFNKMDQQNNMKESSLSFGEGISDQSFLSDSALPTTMWYP